MWKQRRGQPIRGPLPQTGEKFRYDLSPVPTGIALDVVFDGDTTEEPLDSHQSVARLRPGWVIETCDAIVGSSRPSRPLQPAKTAIFDGRHTRLPLTLVWQMEHVPQSSPVELARDRTPFNA